MHRANEQDFEINDCMALALFHRQGADSESLHFLYRYLRKTGPLERYLVIRPAEMFIVWASED